MTTANEITIDPAAGLSSGHHAARLPVLVFPPEVVELPQFKFFERGAHAAKHIVGMRGETIIQGEQRPMHDRLTMLRSMARDPLLGPLLAARLADRTPVASLFEGVSVQPFETTAP